MLIWRLLIWRLIADYSGDCRLRIHWDIADRSASDARRPLNPQSIGKPISVHR